jgi:hypothetical protein
MRQKATDPSHGTYSSRQCNTNGEIIYEENLVALHYRPNLIGFLHLKATA